MFFVEVLFQTWLCLESLWTRRTSEGLVGFATPVFMSLETCFRDEFSALAAGNLWSRRHGRLME